MLQDLNFDGKTAIITGAGRGIGLATAKVLASYGAHVILAARSTEAINKGAEKIRESGGKASAFSADVSQYGSVTALVDFAIRETGQVDILVNNAGIIEPLKHLIESDPEIWGQAADINYKGVYHGIRAASPHMIKSGGGIIINISSGAANSAAPMINANIKIRFITICYHP